MRLYMRRIRDCRTLIRTRVSFEMTNRAAAKTVKQDYYKSDSSDVSPEETISVAERSGIFQQLLEHRQGFPDPTKPEPSVQVFTYIGTPSDTIGKNGDYYLEEDTNILYGPKVDGVWPEDGYTINGPVLRRKKKGPQQSWSPPSRIATSRKRTGIVFAKFCLRFFDALLAKLLQQDRVR